MLENAVQQVVVNVVVSSKKVAGIVAKKRAKKIPICLAYRERTVLTNPSLVGQMSVKKFAFRNKILLMSFVGA